MGTPAPRAAIYLRVSQDRENNRLSVDRHRAQAEMLAAIKEYSVVELYEDNDITGAGGRRREHFERLLADIDKGLIDVVIAQE